MIDDARLEVPHTNRSYGKKATAVIRCDHFKRIVFWGCIQAQLRLVVKFGWLQLCALRQNDHQEATIIVTGLDLQRLFSSLFISSDDSFLLCQNLAGKAFLSEEEGHGNDVAG